MEFIGAIVKKEFKGLGILSGAVKSYDPVSGLFEVLYEDGGSEELELGEVVVLAGGGAEKKRRGRKPSKRRRIGVAPGKVSGNLVRGSVGGDELLEKECEFGGSEPIVSANGNLKKSSDGFRETLKGECGFGGESDEIGYNNGNLGVTDNPRAGLDLNAGFDLNLNDGCDSNANFEVNFQKRDCIDLNLDVSQDPDWNENMNMSGSVVKTQKRACDFDLNLGVDEEIKDAEGDGEGEMKIGTVVDIGTSVEEKAVECFSANGTSKEVPLDIDERIVVNGAMDAAECAPEDACLVLVEGVKREGSISDVDPKANVSLEALDASSKDCKSPDVKLRDGLSEDGTTGIHDYEGHVGSSCKTRSGRRKKRKLPDTPATEIVLRRSARRGSTQNNVSSATTLCAIKDQPLSPLISAITEDKPILSDREASEEPSAPLPKPQLPQSSQNLNFDGIPVLDLFSVYSCLRSFSTLLYLSPFQLEDFVAAVKCTYPSSLFDCVHVSILQTLRKHLEYLSSEGSQSASDCLRSLNWDLLDLITWPIFMVEYLLIHSSGLKPDFDLTNQFKLHKSDYYKQPTSLKVEILRCLCDDLVEVEAIRSELNRRSLAAELGMDFDQNVGLEIYKKRRHAVDVSGGSCTTMEVDETNDWNSDECCLCKMDGSLICCDGCPAAYHSKCVGVANDLLPEGDWYCPECSTDRHKPWMKPRKSLRGAELLGIDPHGRPYFSCCGYLIISDDCDTGVLYNYYDKNDLHIVTEVLKSSDVSYSSIVMAIYKHWDDFIGSDKADSSLDSVNRSVCSDMVMKGVVPNIFTPLEPLASPETHEVSNDERSQKVKSTNRNSGNGVEVLRSAEMVQMSSVVEKFQEDGIDNSNVPGSLITNSLDTGFKDSIDSANPDHVLTMINTGTKGNISQVQWKAGYINCYNFAQTAFLVSEELSHKSSEKIIIKSEEEIISIQLKAISKQSSKFCWQNIQGVSVDVLKEKCGWCFSCRAPTDDRDCLINTIQGPVQGWSYNEEIALQANRDQKGHLIDIIRYVLRLEDRLRGLLKGPWLNPHYSKFWKENVIEALDVASIKYLLLALESNLRHRALSAEWLKHVDSVVTMGSATHFSAPSARASSKLGISRKRARGSDMDPNPSSNATGGLGLFWWRGGRLSRQVFNWKGLPRSLVSKAARQAGRSKIPGILYPENSDYAKRSKYVVWRAAVEASTSPEQLALQIREFDLNIKWDDVENTHPLPLLDMESRKSVRLFKKVIVRRKCIEGDAVKYLLDFGKRKAVPDVVRKFGSIVEDSSSERKKYWLEESHLPLHLLRNFEEKRIARKGNSTKPGKVLEIRRKMRRGSKERGFSYLFSRAEKSEFSRCGHCKKDVLIREAVNCLHCKGSFHKRHVKKSAGAILSECTYTCHKCEASSSIIDAKREKISPKGKKSPSQKGKYSTENTSVSPKISKAKKKVSALRAKKIQSGTRKRGVEAVIPLRRSARHVQIAPLKNKNLGAKKGGPRGPLLKSKRGRPPKSKRGRPPKSNNAVQPKQKKVTLVKENKRVIEKPIHFGSWGKKKKRTFVHHSYWLNGLRLSRKPDDERVMQFRRAMHFSGEKVLAPSEGLSAILDQPICKLCSEMEHTSTSSYIACETCQEWFHGEAFGLNAQNIGMVIGFMCHICRMKSPPVCPSLLATESQGCALVEKLDSGVKCSEEASDIVPPLNQAPTHESHLNGDLDAVLDKEKELCSDPNLSPESESNPKQCSDSSNQSPKSKFNPEPENEISNASKKQKVDAPQNPQMMD